MGRQRVICANGERVDGRSALGDGVCGGAADYGDGEDGTGEGGGWGGKCFFFLFFLLPLSFLVGGGGRVFFIFSIHILWFIFLVRWPISFVENICLENGFRK